MNGHVPTVADVDRIVALDDAVLRNLRITQCYYELSSALAAKTGPTANWCTFATWASKQAGQTIRREDLAETLQNLSHRPPDLPESTGRVAASAVEVSESTERIVRTAADAGYPRDAGGIRESVRRVVREMPAFDRASEAVAKGNNKVFEEIGREFARFLAACQDGASFDRDRIARFREALRPGDPPTGQRYLKQAFDRYHRALFEDDATNKSELMFLANLEIGYHEQKRLQDEITDALNAPVPDSGQLERLTARIFPHLPKRRTALDAVYDELANRARKLARLVVTRRMMTLALPNGEVLRLGQDLRSEHLTETLERIADPELRALLDDVDPTPDSVLGSGAEDWADFSDRIHFIADLFRAYQDQRYLFDAPFTPEQVVLIKAGRTPPDL